MKSFFVSLVFLNAALAAEATVERLDPALDALIAPGTEVETLAAGFTWLEGPLWDATAGELLFSEIPRNAIHAWHPQKGVRVFMQPSGYTGVADYGREPGSNGLAFDASDRLLCCEHGDRRISVLTKDGGKLTLADRYEGKRFNSPNDLAVHSGGAIYFTDPIYGLPQGEKDERRELDFCGIFRLDPDGRVTLLSRELDRPNGIALSPDEKTLYVNQSERKRPVMLAFSLDQDGGVGASRVFFDAGSLTGKGGLDGLKVDAAGNVWTTGPGGLLVLSPQGKLLGRVLADRSVSNVAFGGENGTSVFLTATDRVLRFERLAGRTENDN